MADEISTLFNQLAIGRMELKKRPRLLFLACSFPPAGAQLTREDFIRGITPLHCVILPHEAMHYNRAASGVLLDAIAWGKPVIARKIPIFESIFERYGDIGYLFSDDLDLTRIVEQILQMADRSRYQLQVLNLRTVRKSRAPETLAATYRDICRKNGTGS